MNAALLCRLKLKHMFVSAAAHLSRSGYFCVFNLYPAIYFIVICQNEDDACTANNKIGNNILWYQVLSDGQFLK